MCVEKGRFLQGTFLFLPSNLLSYLSLARAGAIPFSAAADSVAFSSEAPAHIIQALGLRLKKKMARPRITRATMRPRIGMEKRVRRDQVRGLAPSQMLAMMVAPTGNSKPDALAIVV